LHFRNSCGNLLEVKKTGDVMEMGVLDLVDLFELAEIKRERKEQIENYERPSRQSHYELCATIKRNLNYGNVTRSCLGY